MARPRLAWMLGLLIVALPQSAAAAGWKALVVNDRHGGGGETVSVIDTQNDTVIRTVAVGFTPFGIAITPDAGTAWVANVDTPVPGEASLQSIDLTANPIAAGPRLPADPDQPITVAVTPDGTSAYAASGTSLVRLDLTKTPPVLSHIALDRATNFIAITPNGRTAYLSAKDGNVVPVDLPTATEGTPIPVGATPRGIAVTPDGTRVVVAVNGTDSVRVIDTATNGLAAKAATVPGANEIAIAPDGATAWVTTWNGTDESATTPEDGYVIPVDLGSLDAGTRVNVRNSDDTGQAWGVAITPDGRKLYVSDGRFNNTSPNGTTARAVDLTASPPTVGSPIAVGSSPRVIAITPDQAPIARFNVTAVKAGSASSFDASISTPGATTPTARYDWDFGDGTQAATSAPTTTHTYARGGSFTVTLTETTAGGTSTAQVYTGQTLLRAGAPGARSQRTLDIAGDAQPGGSITTPGSTVRSAPALALDASSVDFGRILLKVPATRTVGVTNVGDAALHVSSATIDGGSGFSVAGNTCGDVAPGAHCGIDVRFAPVDVPPTEGFLRITSDAPGSPHLVRLTGSAIDLRSVAGRVLDQRGGGVAGVTVEACVADGSACRDALSAADGGYRLTDVAPGAYRLRAFPPTKALQAGDERLTLGDALEVSHDITLQDMPGLSPDVRLVTPSGSFSSGRPSVWYGDPLEFHVRVPGVPSEADPGTRLRVEAALEVTNNGHTETLSRTGVVTYGRDRSGSVVPAAAGRRATVRGTDKCGEALRDYDAAKRARDDADSTLDWLADKTIEGYQGLAFTGTIQQLDDAQKKLWDATDSVVEDCSQDRWPEGLTPPPPPVWPGPGAVRITLVTRVDGKVQEERFGGVYIDPSGLVTTTDGVPLAGATVTLERRDDATAAFGPLPDGSALMSPGNRRNPDRTDAIGRFGWDVLAGTYRVSAIRKGCTGSAVSAPLDVPPPQLGIRLKLRCAKIRRASTRLSGRKGDGGKQLVATVRARARTSARPRGTVTFRAGSKRVASAPLDPVTGVAVARLAKKPKGAVRAAYSGDARFKPSSGRVRPPATAAP